MPSFNPFHYIFYFSAFLTCFAMWHSLYSIGGVMLIMKMWFMPYLVFNFWLSTYTYFHHKSLDISWIEKDKWNKAQAQLFHTAHVDYHPIIEALHFDINWHIPHHVTFKIPWWVLLSFLELEATKWIEDVIYLFYSI